MQRVVDEEDSKEERVGLLKEASVTMSAIGGE